MSLYVSVAVLLAVLFCNARPADAYHTIPVKRLWNPAKAHRLDVPQAAIARYKNGGKWGSTGSVNSSSKVALDTYEYGIQYIGEASIGTPAQTFNVLFETSTSYSWISALGCPVYQCNDARQYNPGKSSTFGNVDATGTVTTGEGTTAKGHYGTDMIQVGEEYVNNQLFMRIGKDDSVTGPLGDFGHWDGVIGLGFLPMEKDYDAWFPNAVAHQKTLTRCFSFWFDPFVQDNGVLTVGGYNSSHYRERLVDVPVIPESNWAIRLDSIQVDFNTVYNVTISEDSDDVPLIAQVSSGHSYISGPTAPVEFIMSRTYSTQTAWHTYEVACENRTSLPDLVFRMGDIDADVTDVEYVLHGEDYVTQEKEHCVVGITTPPDDSSNKWILGEPFIRRVFTVFDYENPAAPKLRMAYARGILNGAPSISSALAIGLMSTFVVYASIFAGF